MISTIAAGVLALILGAVVVAFLFRKDDGIEQRRRAAMNAHATAQEMKHDALAELLLAYGVGDYSGMLKTALSTLSGVTRQSLFEANVRITEYMLPLLLRDPNYVDKLKKIFATELHKSNRSVDVTTFEKRTATHNLEIHEQPHFREDAAPTRPKVTRTEEMDFHRVERPRQDMVVRHSQPQFVQQMPPQVSPQQGDHVTIHRDELHAAMMSDPNQAHQNMRAVRQSTQRP